MNRQEAHNSQNMRALTPADMARRMAEYESKHSVEEYQLQGWHIWPLLRNTLSRAVIDASCGKQPNEWGRNKRESFKSTCKTFARRALGPFLRTHRRDPTCCLPDSSLADAVVLGPSGRHQSVMGDSHQYVTDPVAEIIESHGLVCRRWAVGIKVAELSYQTDFIDLSLYRATHLVHGKFPQHAIEEAPEWFPAFQQFQCSLRIEPWDWERLNKVAYTIYLKSTVFEHWLRAINAKILFLDCWYSWDMYAATLGAKRCGVKVVDVQHGIQEKPHFAYHFWTRAPVSGYSCLPDLFWVWGEKAAKIHRDTNSIGTEVLPLGNPWIQRWLHAPNVAMKASVDEVSDRLNGFCRRILVTTGKPASMDLPFLQKLIEACPKDWAWMIRVHPLLPEDRDDVRTVLCAESPENVFVEFACDSPLYALFQNVDWHVSHDSTCAIEAMCFGVHTAIISAAGRRVFGEFIEHGVMSYFESPTDLARHLSERRMMDSRTLETEAEDIFGQSELLPADLFARLLPGTNITEI